MIGPKFRAWMKIGSAAIVCLATFSAAAGDAAVADKAWGPAVGGLRMSLSAAGNDAAGDPKFQLALENVGDDDVTLNLGLLNLGLMLANGKPLSGKSLFPANFRLQLTDPQGTRRELHFAGPNVAGRVDDFAVPLRVGSVYVLNVPLKQFVSTDNGEPTLELKPGRHQVSAEFIGGDAEYESSQFILNFWEGKLRSNTLILPQ
jgi:hypothetical protein